MGEHNILNVILIVLKVKMCQNILIQEAQTGGFRWKMLPSRQADRYDKIILLTKCRTASPLHTPACQQQPHRCGNLVLKSTC